MFKRWMTIKHGSRIEGEKNNSLVCVSPDMQTRCYLLTVSPCPRKNKTKQNKTKQPTSGFLDCDFYLP